MKNLILVFALICCSLVKGAAVDSLPNHLGFGIKPYYDNYYVLVYDSVDFNGYNNGFIVDSFAVNNKLELSYYNRALYFMMAKLYFEASEGDTVFMLNKSDIKRSQKHWPVYDKIEYEVFGCVKDGELYLWEEEISRTQTRNFWGWLLTIFGNCAIVLIMIIICTEALSKQSNNEWRFYINTNVILLVIMGLGVLIYSIKDITLAKNYYLVGLIVSALYGIILAFFRIKKELKKKEKEQ